MTLPGSHVALGVGDGFGVIVGWVGWVVDMVSAPVRVRRQEAALKYPRVWRAWKAPRRPSWISAIGDLNLRGVLTLQEGWR